MTNYRRESLISLFSTFFKIGLFTFGGGHAMIPLIQKEAVEHQHWISNDDILDIIAIAESTPGPIAVNSATFIGYHVAGVFGSLFATLGVALPSFLIIFIISFFYETFMTFEVVQWAMEGIYAAVTILILQAAFKLALSLQKKKQGFLVWILALSTLALIWFTSLSSFLLIGGGALLGLLYFGIYLPNQKRRNPQ